MRCLCAIYSSGQGYTEGFAAEAEAGPGRKRVCVSSCCRYDKGRRRSCRRGGGTTTLRTTPSTTKDQGSKEACLCRANRQRTDSPGRPGRASPGNSDRGEANARLFLHKLAPRHRLNIATAAMARLPAATRNAVAASTSAARRPSPRGMETEKSLSLEKGS